LARKKTASGIFALLLGGAMLLFSAWYFFFFKAENLVSTASGIPSEFGLITPFNSDGKNAIGYQLRLQNDPRLFVIRMYGEDFNARSLDSALGKKQAIDLMFHPGLNEKSSFDVYEIKQNQKTIYSFNKKFSRSSSRFLGWFIFVTGAVVFLFGGYSFSRKN
jgi:hypothetical protein